MITFSTWFRKQPLQHTLRFYSRIKTTCVRGCYKNKSQRRVLAELSLDKSKGKARKMEKLDEVRPRVSRPSLYLPPRVGGQEKEESKWVKNRRIEKKKKGLVGFKKGKIRCTQAGYCHTSCLLMQPL